MEMVKQIKADMCSFLKRRELPLFGFSPSLFNRSPVAGYRLLILLVTGYWILAVQPAQAADLFPGRGSFMSANSVVAALQVKTTSVGVSLLEEFRGQYI